MGIIYVFDLTNQESLDNLVHWKDKVEDEYPNRIKTLLIGNKKDLKMLREVSEETAQRFQNTFNIDQYQEISALDPMGGT